MKNAELFTFFFLCYTETRACFMTYGIFVWQAGEKSESRERQDAL